MRFDGNQAWKQAAAWIEANRDVVIAVAGVFFLLPSLVAAVFGPEPPVAAAGMTAPQMVAAVQGYYFRALPYVIPMLLLQAIGVLALLKLFTDARRPTVGGAIRQSLGGFLSYCAALLLAWFGVCMVAIAIFVVAGLLVAVLGAGMAVPLTVVAFAIAFALAIYVLVRCSLSGPVIAVERTRNPITALTRSWALTRGSVGHLILFYAMVAVLLLVIVYAVTLVAGIVLALVLSRPNAVLVTDVISSIMGATATVFVVAVLAAVHRQLVGPTLVDQRATFE